MNDTLIKSLLIVDDEAPLRTALGAIFLQAGLDVRTAQDGLGALAEIRRAAPDILVSDLDMPGMSGFELLSLVRRRFPSIHVVAMSGAFSGEGMQLGVPADCFYEKGSDLANLLRMVQNPACHKRQPASSEGSPLPLWVRKHGHDVDGPYAVVACPDCMRAFPQPLDEVEITVLHHTNCEYCESPIEYALLPQGDASIVQAVQRRPKVVAPPLSLVSNLRSPPRRHSDSRPAAPAMGQTMQRLRSAG